MIVRKDKTFETNSQFPNVDWYNEENYVVDETTEVGRVLARKIIENYPYFNFVLDSEGKLIDISPTERPVLDPVEEEKTELKLIQERLTQLEQENAELREIINAYLGGGSN